MTAFSSAAYFRSGYRVFFDLKEEELEIWHREESSPDGADLMTVCSFRYRGRPVTVYQAVAIAGADSLSRFLFTEGKAEVSFNVTVFEGTVLPNDRHALTDAVRLGGNYTLAAEGFIEVVQIRSLQRCLEFVKSILDGHGSDPEEESAPLPLEPSALFMGILPMQP